MTDGHDTDVQVLDTSIVRLHQDTRCAPKCGTTCTDPLRGGLTTTIHARVDAKGTPIQLTLGAGQECHSPLADELLTDLRCIGILPADRACDSDAIRNLVHERVACANILPREIAET